MSKSFFNLSGNDYWADPWKNLKDIAWDAMSKGTPMFVVDAPALVPLEERKTIPLLAFRGGPSVELEKNRFEDLAVIVLAEPEDSRVWAQRLPRPSAPPPPGGPVQPGFACLEYQIELTDLFGIPWQPSSYIATIFLREAASNRVAIKLGRGQTAYEDPQVQKFLDAQRTKKPPRLVEPPSSAILRHGAVQGSLPVPDKAGIEMRVERVVVGHPDLSAWLDVSFRLPVSKTDVLPPVETPPAENAPIENAPIVEPVRPETARAVVSLLIFGSDSSVPNVFRFVVPSFDKVEGETDSPVAQGAFAVDLAKLANLAKVPQTYFVYAFSGELMSGPAVVAVVDPRLIPIQPENPAP